VVPAAFPVATVPDVSAPPTVAAAAAGVPGWLIDLFGETAGIPADALDPDTEFRDLGIESVLLAELVRRIEERVGTAVPPSLLLEHPTLHRLAAALPAPAAAPVATVRPAVPGPPAASGKVAVIGLAARMPGAADADAFWDDLVAGRSAVTEVPPGRWSAAELYPGRTVSKWGGFVDGIEDFDAAWFGMSEEEATCLDPGIRLMLECSVAALRDAGYRDDEVRGRDVAVFAGARLSGYRHRAGIRGGAAGLGADQNFVAARVADALDLHGPNLVVDSACSSALVAVGLACRSLLSGESELALAGGVEILLDEEPYLQFTAARALSPSGRCATFDADADGFVPGEGGGVVLLKELGAAIRDGDRIRAVIDAVAVNNDGRTMGLTTPNPVAQAAVVRRALAASGYGARDVGLLEAHGTGTMIGDPIELRALTEVYRESTVDTGYCGLGSVKTNIGHLLSAAGIAGLLKVILAVERGVRPPTLHCRRPNPRFDFAASPFAPQLAAEPWPGRRVAGVSAFGLGGTNAHAIVSAPEPRAVAGVVRRPLPPPRFQRRRYWLERPGTPPSPAPAVSSLLDLRFVRTVRTNGRVPS
jgi:acyl transferase domain-containing protein/acyl carrier protein